MKYELQDERLLRKFPWRFYPLKDGRVKIFQSIDFFKFLLLSDSELFVSEMKKKKKNGDHRLRFRVKRCGKLP